MAKKAGGMLGKWAFLIGIILAIIMGALGDVTANLAVMSALLVIGVIVGLLNVGAKEASPFLLAAVSLVLVANFGPDVLTFDIAKQILGAIMVLIIPATIIVAIREVFSIAGK
jgi:hypothetical protein